MSLLQKHNVKTIYLHGVGPTPKVQSNYAAQCAKRNEETGGQHLLIKTAKTE